METVSECTRAGTAPAREEGEQLGWPQMRPLAEDLPFPRVRDLVEAGVLTRADDARLLRVRYEIVAAALQRGEFAGGTSEQLGSAA